MRARGPRICTSSFPKSARRPTLLDGLVDLRAVGLSCRATTSSFAVSGERSPALPRGARGPGGCDRRRATPRDIQGRRRKATVSAANHARRRAAEGGLGYFAAGADNGAGGRQSLLYRDARAT